MEAVKYEQIYQRGLYEHNERLKEANLPESNGFEHYIHKIDGEDCLLIPQGVYKDNKGRDHVAGLGVKLIKDRFHLYKNRFHLYGFVTDDNNKFNIVEFENACRTGGQTGELGAVLTLTNYFNLINDSTRNSILLQVIPHLNTAVNQAALKAGFELPDFSAGYKSLLERELNAVTENILSYEHNKNKMGEDELYNGQLHIEFSGTLVNLLNLDLTNDEESGIVEILSRNEFAAYINNTLSNIEYIHTGYGGLKKTLNKVKSNLFKHLDELIPEKEYKAINSLMDRYNLTVYDIGFGNNITSLDLSSKNINSLEELTELGEFANLQHLYLRDNEIENIEPLQHFTNLKTLQRLVLRENQIKNIETLKYFINLNELYLSCNKIENIDTLKHLTNLEELCLFNNQISDIDSLQYLTNLQYLDLAVNKITNIDALSTIIKNLQTLDLRVNPLKKDFFKI